MHGTSQLPLRCFFFLAKELVRTSSLSRLGTVAPDRRLREQHGVSVCASCEWGQSATKLTMNVSIKTSCFRSKTPTESSCRRSMPDRNPSASRVHVPAYRWVGSFAKACHSKSFYSGFLLFLEQQGEHEYHSLTKKSGTYYTSFNQQRIDKEPASKAKIYENQRVRRDGANLKAHIASRAFPREIPVRGRFLWMQFSTTFHRRIFSQTNGIRLVGAPRAHFHQKLKIDK